MKRTERWRWGVGVNGDKGATKCDCDAAGRGTVRGELAVARMAQRSFEKVGKGQKGSPTRAVLTARSLQPQGETRLCAKTPPARHFSKHVTADFSRVRSPEHIR